jgi:hypothetical protein
MKNKNQKPKLIITPIRITQTPVEEAFAVLHAHGIKYWTFEDSEFEEEWIIDLWETYDIKRPSAAQKKRAKELAYQDVLEYSWTAMQDAVYEVCREHVERKSKNKVSITRNDYVDVPTSKKKAKK